MNRKPTLAAQPPINCRWIRYFSTISLVVLLFYKVQITCCDFRRNALQVKLRVLLVTLFWDRLLSVWLIPCPVTLWPNSIPLLCPRCLSVVLRWAVLNFHMWTRNGCCKGEWAVHLLVHRGIFRLLSELEQASLVKAKIKFCSTSVLHRYAAVCSTIILYELKTTYKPSCNPLVRFRHLVQSAQSLRRGGGGTSYPAVIRRGKKAHICPVTSEMAYLSSSHG